MSHMAEILHNALKNIPLSLLSLLLRNQSTCLLSNLSVAGPDYNYRLCSSPAGESFLPCCVTMATAEVFWGCLWSCSSDNPSPL